VNLPPFSIARSRQDATVKKRLRSCAIPCAFHVHTTAMLIVAKSVSLRSSMGGFGKFILLSREWTFRLTAAKVSEEPTLTDAAKSTEI
jgi:hypothetical protein